jgi:Pyruvate/2-oxoacid:ferredoxin oxidoreductase delta subunit
VELVDLLKFVVPLLGAAVAWLWNERRRRSADEYQRKEQKYSVLIEAAEGFYTHMAGVEEAKHLKETFLLELRKCWLYCPDEVIYAANRWMDLQMVESNSTNEQRLAAVADFIATIRRDLLSRKPVKRTRLTASDYRHMRVT